MGRLRFQIADSCTKVIDNYMLRDCLHLGKYCLHDETKMLKSRSDARTSSNVCDIMHRTCQRVSENLRKSQAVPSTPLDWVRQSTTLLYSLSLELISIKMNCCELFRVLGMWKPCQFTTYPSKENLQSRRVAFRGLGWLREPAVGEGSGLSHSYCAGHISGLWSRPILEEKRKPRLGHFAV